MSNQSSIPMNDNSGRAKSNSQQNTGYFKDLSRRFNDLKVNEKKKKRNSLTDFEAFDSTAQHGSRSRGAGGGIVVSRPSGSHNHAKALREIRSSLEPYAQASDITWESVHSLAQELNVDQTTAEQYARNCPNLEAAREKLIQVLKKKMRDERQMQMPQANLKQQYMGESQRGKLLLPGNAYHHISPDTRDNIDRGSPDGASFRAESPIYPGGHATIDLNNGRHISSADMVPDYQRTSYVENVPQSHMRHDMSPPAYNSDYVIPHQNRISSSPQSSLSDNVGSESGMKHVSMQRPSSPFQGHMKHPDRAGVGHLPDNIGVSPGHVQQIVKRIQIPPSGVWPLQVPAATMMNDEHKPIIKGVSVGSKLPHQPLVVKGNPQTGLGLSVSNMPAHPPPSYGVAQQFCNTQKHRGHGNPQGMGTYEVVPVNDQMESAPREQQWTDAINGVLMGNINYPAPPLSSSESLPSSSPRSSLSSSYQVLAAPCHASFMPLANPSILQPVSSKPVKKPQPMMADMPMNHEGVLSNHLPPHQTPMSFDDMGIDPGYDHSGLTYQATMNLGSGRDPPPYRENPYSGNPSDEVDSIQHSDHNSSIDSRMVMQDDNDMYMRKPSIVDNYLSSVSGVSSNTNTNSNNYQAAPPNPLPKGTEAAVKAARVTAGNSKRHAGSYSAVSAAKQHKPGSVAGLHNATPTNDPPPNYEEKKTIRTSPVPMRKKSAKGPKSNGLSSDSEEGSEEGSEGPTKTPWTKRVKMYTPAAYKFYMEQHIENVIKGCRSRVSRRMQLEQEMTKMNLPPQDQDQMRTMLFQKESNYIRLKRGKINLSMFRIVKPLGVGAFGTVYLACKTSSGALYAIKTLRKKDVLKRNQVAHVKAERDILSEADNDWVVRLYYTFQDKHFLYFVMDYIPGGDMMSLLIKKGIFEEPLAQFYTAELTLALESVHKMGFIHRDIKPDNILIDRDGHIKLTDFGLCTGFRWTHDSKYYQREVQGHMRQDSMDFSNEWKYGGCALKTLDRRRMHDANRRVARSLVGTPNYIAPEVLLREGYTQLCDWWSVGVILYEMVVGQPPFNATSPEETQLKVINWKEMLYFPESARLSRHTKDIILRLCCDQSVRLGCKGVEEIKNHPYFRKVNWQDLRKMHAPHIPRITHPEDTSNFDPPDTGFMLDPSRTGTLNSSNTLLRAGEHAFFEFTFRRFFDDDGRAYSNSNYSNFEGQIVDEEDSESGAYGSYNESSQSYNGQDEEEFRV